MRAEAAEEKAAASLQTREGKKRECGRAKDESRLRRGGRNGSIKSTFLSHSTKAVLESKGVLTLGMVALYPNTTIATPSLALTDTAINAPAQICFSGHSLYFTSSLFSQFPHLHYSLSHIEGCLLLKFMILWILCLNWGHFWTCT